MMIFKTPGQLPAFGVLVDDMAANRAQVADYLGCNLRVLGRWVEGNNAPRMACLSLFWLSRWGLSVLEVDASNLVAILRSQVVGLEDECANLRARIRRMEALAAAPGGAVNEAFYQPVSGPVVRASRPL